MRIRIEKKQVYQAIVRPSIRHVPYQYEKLDFSYGGRVGSKGNAFEQLPLKSNFTKQIWLAGYYQVFWAASEPDELAGYYQAVFWAASESDELAGYYQAVSWAASEPDELAGYCQAVSWAASEPDELA